MEYYIPKFLEMRKLSKEEDKEELLSDKVLSDRPIVIANTRKH
jgi:arsenate reductase-like glutaredoxin family protein